LYIESLNRVCYKQAIYKAQIVTNDQLITASK